MRISRGRVTRFSSFPGYQLCIPINFNSHMQWYFNAFIPWIHSSRVMWKVVVAPSFQEIINGIASVNWRDGWGCTPVISTPRASRNF